MTNTCANNTVRMLLYVSGVIAVVAVLDGVDLCVAVVGALGYAAVKAMRDRRKTGASPKTQFSAKLPPADEQHVAFKSSDADKTCAKKNFEDMSLPTDEEDTDQKSAGADEQTDQKSEWDAEVCNFLRQASPRLLGTTVRQLLKRTIEDAIKPAFPEASVHIIVHGKPTPGQAFAVAAPDIDIVVTANSKDLLQGMQRELPASTIQHIRDGTGKIQKEAIRFCAAKLMTDVYGFKMKRAAFRGEDPKMVMLAPVLVGDTTVRVPVTFSVNALSACQYAALLAECGRLQPCCPDLILVVRRWALQRGLAVTDRGHMSLHAWSLLAIHYLQVQLLLPPLHRFLTSASRQGKSAVTDLVRHKTCKQSIATLFQGFLQFYHNDFQWNNTLVCVRSGPNGAALQKEVGVFIVDPADSRRNHASTLTDTGLQRLKEELARATEMATNHALFSDVMATWRSARSSDECPDEIGAL